MRVDVGGIALERVVSPLAKPPGPPLPHPPNGWASACDCGGNALLQHRAAPRRADWNNFSAKPS
jgi:hypothetical protein